MVPRTEKSWHRTWPTTWSCREAKSPSWHEQGTEPEEACSKEGCLTKSTWLLTRQARSLAEAMATPTEAQNTFAYPS